MLFLIFYVALLKNVLSVAWVLLSSTFFCHQLQDLSWKADSSLAGQKSSAVMQMRAEFSKIQIATYKTRKYKNKANHKLNFYRCRNFGCHVVSLFWSFVSHLKFWLRQIPWICAWPTCDSVMLCEPIARCWQKPSYSYRYAAHLHINAYVTL